MFRIRFSRIWRLFLSVSSVLLHFLIHCDCEDQMIGFLITGKIGSNGKIIWSLGNEDMSEHIRKSSLLLLQLNFSEFYRYLYLFYSANCTSTVTNCQTKYKRCRCCNCLCCKGWSSCICPSQRYSST